MGYGGWIVFSSLMVVKLFVHGGSIVGRGPVGGAGRLSVCVFCF